jgi:hypothetical protein
MKTRTRQNNKQDRAARQESAGEKDKTRRGRNKTRRKQDKYQDQRQRQDEDQTTKAEIMKPIQDNDRDARRDKRRPA